MRITLLRHAETPGNLLKRYIGATDESLSEEGVSRTRHITVDAGIKQVYTSALQRTRQTAQLLFPRAEIVPIVELNEMSFGIFEGKTADEMEHDAAYRTWVDGLCEGACPGGESMASFAQRCVSAFKRLVAVAEASGTDELTFVVHGGVIKAILSRLATPVKGLFEWDVDFCGGYLLEYDQRQQKENERPLRVVSAIRLKR